MAGFAHRAVAGVAVAALIAVELVGVSASAHGGKVHFTPVVASGPGVVTVRDLPGRGCVFTVELPLATAHTHTEDTAAPPA